MMSLVAVWAVLSSCGDAPIDQPVRRPLRIGIDLWAGYYPLILAQDLGYLQQAGVEVEVAIPKDTSRMLAQFAAREHDAVAVSLGDIVTVTRVVQDVRLVLVSDESLGADQILGRSPVRGADDVRGKTIGTNLGGFGELLVRRFLQSHGLTTTDVRLVNVEAAQVPDRLARRELDLGHTWEPYASAAQAGGAVPVFSSADTPGMILDGLIFRGEVLQARHHEVERLVDAWFRAVDWWNLNPEEGNRRIEKRLGLQAGEAQQAGVRLLTRADNHRLMTVRDGTSPLLQVAETYIDFFVRRGTLAQRPDARALIDMSFLP